MTRSYDPDSFMETAYPDYIEVTSRDAGGPVRSFRCPHCRAIFDASSNAQLAFESCMAHSKACGLGARVHS